MIECRIDELFGKKHTISTLDFLIRKAGEIGLIPLNLRIFAVARTRGPQDLIVAPAIELVSTRHGGIAAAVYRHCHTWDYNLYTDLKWQTLEQPEARVFASYATPKLEFRCDASKVGYDLAGSVIYAHEKEDMLLDLEIVLYNGKLVPIIILAKQRLREIIPPTGIIAPALNDRGYRLYRGVEYKITSA